MIKEEVEDVRISAEDYMELLKRVNYAAQAIPKLPQFRGKHLIVVGDVNLRDNDKITDLGPITIDGRLEVSRTNIKSLDHTKVTGHSSYWQTPYENVMFRRRQAAKMEEQKEKRRDGDWDMNSNLDEEGIRANLVFQFAVDEGHIEELDEDEKERVQEIKKEIKRLEDDEEYTDEIQDQIDELEDELSDLLKGKFDVYYLYPSGTFYDMTEFELLEDGSRYAIGTEDEAEESMRDYYQEWVDDPETYLDSNFLSYHIDEEAVVDDARYAVEDWVRDSPEDYGVERTELSSSQEEEIERLEDQISELKEKLDELEDEDEIQEVQDEIDQLESEIEDIKDFPEGDYSEEDIEQAIEDYLDDNVRRDPADWLRDMGRDIADYVDKDDLLDALVRNGDYGDTLNAYDGTYESVRYGNDYYIIMRVEA